MSFYRNTVWFLKGLREYTKGGYESASKDFRESDLAVDCTGQQYMITGANSGIGKCIAIEIAKRGGTIHMVCRNPKTAEEAKTEIIEASNNQNVHLHLLDMSKPVDVHKFSQTFIENNEKLHVLVNNAGCMINNREVTEENLEKNFVTNTLSTHILTTSLIPLLRRADKARVVIITSGGMLVQKLNSEDLQFEKMKPFDGTMAYAQNKRQQVVMTEHYGNQYPEIHFSCMHPGWADTPAVRNSMPDFYEKMKDKLRTPLQGADTAIWLAISSAALNNPTGLFFQDRKPVPTHLPLAWTKVCTKEEEHFMATLNELATKFTN